MIVEEIPFGFVERLAAACLVGHILITYATPACLTVCDVGHKIHKMQTPGHQECGAVQGPFARA